MDIPPVPPSDGAFPQGLAMRRCSCAHGQGVANSGPEARGGQGMVDGAGRLTRRRMLGAAGGVALGALAAPAMAQRARSAYDRVNLAVIGAGGKGSDDMAKLTGENIVAICDVDYDHVARGMLDSHFEMQPTRVALKAAYDKAQRFSDYRRMLDQRKDIDAVLIA